MGVRRRIPNYGFWTDIAAGGRYDRSGAGGRVPCHCLCCYPCCYLCCYLRRRYLCCFTGMVSFGIRKDTDGQGRVYL